MTTEKSVDNYLLLSSGTSAPEESHNAYPKHSRGTTTQSHIFAITVMKRVQGASDDDNYQTAQNPFTNKLLYKFQVDG